MAKVNPVPAGQPVLSPYLTVKDANAAIAFYKQAFGATEKFRLTHDNKMGHAEIVINGSPIMLSDEFPDYDALAPDTIGGTPVTLHLYVGDVDAVVKQAVAAGAKILRPVEDQFYGDRGGKLQDPFGHRWWIGSRIEDLSEAEIKQRAAKLFG